MKRYILALMLLVLIGSAQESYAQPVSNSGVKTQRSFFDFQVEQIESILKLEGDRLAKFRELYAEYFNETRKSKFEGVRKGDHPKPTSGMQHKSPQQHVGDHRAGGRGGKPEDNLVRGIYNRINTLSDEQIDEQIKESFERAKKAIELKEEYYTRFCEFLTPREVATMYELERRTRERLVDEMCRRAGGAQTPQNR